MGGGGRGASFFSENTVPSFLFCPVRCLIFIIIKTYLYNFDPLTPNLYIVKLGFSGVYSIFLISAQKTYGEAVLTSTHNLCF